MSLKPTAISPIPAFKSIPQVAIFDASAKPKTDLSPPLENIAAGG
jgi:hypothetical protein